LAWRRRREGERGEGRRWRREREGGEGEREREREAAGRTCTPPPTRKPSDGSRFW